MNTFSINLKTKKKKNILSISNTCPMKIRLKEKHNSNHFSPLNPFFIIPQLARLISARSNLNLPPFHLRTRGKETFTIIFSRLQSILRASSMGGNQRNLRKKGGKRNNKRRETVKKKTKGERVNF